MENQINAYGAFRRYVESYAPDCHTVVALIRHRAALCPATVAVVDASSALSYEELDRKSDALAMRLRQHGVCTGKYVGIMLPRTKEYIVAILATLKAGGAYVPLDEFCPKSRLDAIMTDSAMSCIIIVGGVSSPLCDAQSVKAIIDIDDIHSDTLRCECAPDYSDESAAACLMYTSGTTGKPKGVIISHRYMMSLAIYGSRLFQLTGSDRVMLHPGFGVIASFGNIFPALVSGSSLHIVSEEMRHDISALRRYIINAGISGGVVYTAIGSQLLNGGATSLRWLMMGGGQLVSPTIPAGTSVYICLGCTEGLFIAHSLIGAGAHEGVMALSMPAACNVTLLIDDAGNQVKQGEIGEIVVTGDVVADGYAGDVQATDSKFGTSPLIDGRTMYRTGDLGRINESGMLEYCGRADRQIKVSGYRIEPGEVEAAILGYEGIEGTIVAAVDINHTKQLCAWYASKQPIADTVIRGHVSRLLPAYMVPTYFIHTPSLLTGYGDKIDVASLPLPDTASDEIVPPRDIAEEKVLAIVKRVLCCENIGVTTDLVKVGLTSLLAMYIATCIEEELQLTLHTWQMLGKSSIRQWLAEARHTGSAVRTYPARRLYPLLAGQWRIYHEMLDDPNNAKNGTCRLIFIPAMSVSRLTAAVERVIEAHQSLGVRIVLHNGVPMMERSDSAKPDFEVYEVADDWNSDECARHLKPFLISEKGNPLVHIAVIGKPSGAYLLIHCAHIIYDGASLQIFLDDLIAALQGKDLRPEPITIFDVSLHEAEYADTDQGLRDKRYFEQLCRGCTAITELKPGNDPSGTVGFSFDTGLIDAYCHCKAITANSFWTTTMLQALHRVTGIRDLAVCTFSNQRSEAEVRRTSGMLLRILPIVSHSRCQEPYEAMRELQSQLTDTMQHEHYPFCKIQHSQNVPFSFLYIFQEGLARLHYPEDWQEVGLALPHDDTRICCVQVFPYASGTEVLIEYNGTSYSRSGAQLFADMWQSVVRDIINNHFKSTEHYGTHEN